MQFELNDYINSTNKPSQVQEYSIQEKSNIFVNKKLFKTLEIPKNSKAKNRSKAGIRKIKNETQNQSNIQYIIAEKKEEKQIFNQTNNALYSVKNLEEAKKFVNEFLKNNIIPYEVGKPVGDSVIYVDLDSSGNIIMNLIIKGNNAEKNVANTKLAFPNISHYESGIPDINNYKPWKFQIKLSPLGIDHSDFKILYLYESKSSPGVIAESLFQGKLHELSLTGPFYPNINTIQNEEKQILNTTNNEVYRKMDILDAKKFAYEFLKKNNLYFTPPITNSIDSSGNIIIKFSVSEVDRRYTLPMPFFHNYDARTYELKLSPLGLDHSEFKLWYICTDGAFCADPPVCLFKGKLSELNLIGPFYPY